MEDRQIVELYWQRDESAIEETAGKYGRYCHAIACRIIGNEEDAREIVNDSYVAAWESIPPHRPELLSTYLGKITRRLALKKYREKTAEKRGGGVLPAAFHELEECIPAAGEVGDSLEGKELVRVINEFLDVLPETERRVFLCRYWYFDSIEEIAARFGFGRSRVKMMLMRTREKLRLRLRKEDVTI